MDNQDVAKLDIKSWIAHSYAQTNILNKILYKKYNTEFIRLKSLVEESVFKLSKLDAKKTAEHLLRASQYHDEAESLDDSGKSSSAIWLKVQNSHYKRFKIIVESNNWYLSIHDKILYDNGYKDLIIHSIASNLSYNETVQWKSHHEKNYELFYIHTIENYKIYGLEPERSKSAVDLLIEACKIHDKIENERDNDLNKGVDPRWNEAYLILKKHYDILINDIKAINTKDNV